MIYLEVNRDVWLGYLSTGKSGQFKGAYIGQDLTFEDWLPVNPDQSIANPTCAMMDCDYGSDFQWRNFYCLEYKAFALCERNITLMELAGIRQMQHYFLDNTVKLVIVFIL